MIPAILLAAMLVVALPVQARAVPLLEPADGEELAQTLAEATDEQGVCYGWAIEVLDQSGGPSGTDAGSSSGPGRAVDRFRCRRWVELAGTITYTSEASEAEDSAGVEVRGNLARTPTARHLEDLGYPADRLTDDDNDEVLIDMVGALPLLVASAGQAPYVPFEEPARPPPGGDRPDAGPGSDWWRNYWWLVALGALGAASVAIFLRPGRWRRRKRPAAVRPEAGTEAGAPDPEAPPPATEHNGKDCA